MKKAYWQLHAAIFLWGFTGVLGRAITLAESWLVWWRLCITVVSLWILFAWLKKITIIPRKFMLQVAGIGCILALHWLCFYGSIKYANVSIALTCLATSGLFSSVLEPLYFRTKIKLQEVFFGLMALAGITIIYFDNLQVSTGVYIGLAASLLTVTVSILNKGLVGKVAPEGMTLYQLTGGFIGLSLLMPLYEYLFPAKQHWPSSTDWLWLFILSWVCTIVTYLLYVKALQKVSAFTINLSLTLEPIYGIALAFAWYQENKQLGSYFGWGFLLILAAVVLHVITTAKQK